MFTGLMSFWNPPYEIIQKLHALSTRENTRNWLNLVRISASADNRGWHYWKYLKIFEIFDEPPSSQIDQMENKHVFQLHLKLVFACIVKTYDNNSFAASDTLKKHSLLF